MESELFISISNLNKEDFTKQLENSIDISIKIIGVEKILFGSDFPILNPSRVLSEIKNIGADNIQKLTSSNAEFLLGLN